MARQRLLALAVFVAAAPFWPQQVAPAAKAWSFEVVSIREDQGGSGSGLAMPKFGPTPDGYQAMNVPVVVAIIAAYVPEVGGRAIYQMDDLIGVPPWMLTTRYDIDAKIAESDLADWKNPALKDVMLRSMLQGMLQERFALKVHRETKEVSVYSLVVGKNGAKLKETDPDAKHEDGMAFPGGAVIGTEFKDGHITLKFYAATMPLLATVLSLSAGKPVQDKTGLTGKYDLEFDRPSAGGAPPSPAAGAGDWTDPGPSVFSVVEKVGLKLEPTRGAVETLMFDHAEKPSAN